MHKMSKNALALGGMKSKEGRDYINQMDEIFVKEHISPGGAADLLAITVMLYKLENTNF